MEQNFPGHILQQEFSLVLLCRQIHQELEHHLQSEMEMEMRGNDKSG